MAPITTVIELRAYARVNYPDDFTNLPPVSTCRFVTGYRLNPDAILLWIGTVRVDSEHSASHNSATHDPLIGIARTHAVFATIDRGEEKRVLFLSGEGIEVDISMTAGKVNLHEPFCRVGAATSHDAYGDMEASHALEAFIRYCFGFHGHYAGFEKNQVDIGAAFRQACRGFTTGQRETRPAPVVDESTILDRDASTDADEQMTQPTPDHGSLINTTDEIFELRDQLRVITLELEALKDRQATAEQASKAEISTLHFALASLREKISAREEIPQGANEQAPRSEDASEKRPENLKNEILGVLSRHI